MKSNYDYINYKLLNAFGMGTMTEEDKKPDDSNQEKNAKQSTISTSNPVSEQIIPPVVESEEEETNSQVMTEAELPEFKSEIGKKLFAPQITSKQAPPTPDVPKELRKLNLKIELKSEQNGFAVLSINDARKITIVPITNQPSPMVK